MCGIIVSTKKSKGEEPALLQKMQDRGGDAASASILYEVVEKATTDFYPDNNKVYRGYKSPNGSWAACCAGAPDMRQAQRLLQQKCPNHGDCISILHTRLSTNNDDRGSWHPAIALSRSRNTRQAQKRKEYLLWHNGILAPSYVRKYGKNDKQWDTQVLVNRIRHLGVVEALAEVRGSFACVLAVFNNVPDTMEVEIGGHQRILTRDRAVPFRREVSVFAFRNGDAPLWFNRECTLLSSVAGNPDYTLAPAGVVLELSNDRIWGQTDYTFPHENTYGM